VRVNANVATGGDLADAISNPSEGKRSDHVKLKGRMIDAIRKALAKTAQTAACIRNSFGN